MPAEPTPSQRNRIHPWIDCWDHMEAQGFTETDANVVMSKFLYTAENRLLGAGGGKYPDPQSWMQAIERAKSDEAMHAADLTDNHGYPDTSGKSPREAHFARLAFLMTKYPNADWDLLMEDQDRAMERRPATMGPRVSPPVTVQMIEDAKQRFLGYREQRQELIASGENPELLMGVIDSMAWKRRELEGYGVDITALIASDAGTASPVSNNSGGSSVSGVSDKPGEAPPSKLPVNKEQRGSAGVSETPPATSAEPSPTITAREAAKIVGIAYTTMLTELGSGRFPFANMVGNQWRISRKGLYDWLEGHRSDVEALKKQKDVVPKPRGKTAAQPRYIRPDGKPLSF